LSETIVQAPPSAHGHRLPRVLGFFDVTILAGASMGPAYSLASTMGPMVAQAGAQAPLALVLLSAIMLCVAIGFARLSRVRPNAGSSYAWIGQAFGNRAGAYAAWILILSNYFATMATAIPAGTYTLDLFVPSLTNSPMAVAIVGVVWIAASGFMLSFGLRPTALVTTIFFLSEMLVLVASGIVAGLFAHPAPVVEARAPIVGGLGGLAGAMVLGIWMSDGWEISASTSEETAGSSRTSGSGGITGLLVTTGVLLIAMIAYLHLGTIPGFVAHQTDALTYVADRLGGGIWRVVIVATVLVSTSAALWTTMVYLSRSVFAMARDGVIFPALGRLDRRDIPVAAVIGVTVPVAVFTLLTGLFPSAAVALNFVINGSSVFLGVLFVGSALAAAWTFRGDPTERWRGVIIPLVGGAGLLAILAVSISQADPNIRWFQLAALAAGVPFALWRGGHGAAAQVGTEG
jgi:amino acid transporter